MSRSATPNQSAQPVGRRFIVVAMIAVAVLLAAGVVAFLAWRVWPAPPAGTVRNLDAAPDTTWQFPLTAGDSVTPISEDEALIFTPGGAGEDRPLLITLVDLESGSVVWQTPVGEHADEVDAYWMRPHHLPGTDFIVVKLFHHPTQPETRHLLVDRGSGEIRHVLDTLGDTSLLTAPSGVPYLVDHLVGEVSQLKHLTDPNDRAWTIPAPEVVDEDGAELQVVHRDGTALVGPNPTGSYSPDDNALWFLAAAVSDGATPPWATAVPDQLFFLIDDVVVHAEAAQLRAVDQGGEALWQSPHPQSARRVAGDLFLIDGEPTSSLALLNPRTGDPRWQTPHVLAPDAMVTAIDGHWMTLSHIPGEQARGVPVSATGQVGEVVQYPAGERAQFFRGTDRWYVAITNADATILLAQRPAESEPMWSATYPAGAQIVQLGRHLVLLAPDEQAMRGLGE